MAAPLMLDNVWLQKSRYEEAEAHYYAVQAGTATPGQAGGQSQGGRTIRNEITQAREQIANALKQPGNQGGAGGNSPQVQKRLDSLEKENQDLRKTTKELQELVRKLESRVSALEKGGKGDAPAASKPAPATPAADDDNEDEDDDFELFGDDDDDEEAEKAREAKKKAALEAYAAKKSKKPELIAKSSIILDVKPWDDETDMKELERLVRTIEKDGLVWGTAKLVDLAYGIKKLVIVCVIEDAKISVDDLQEDITGFEDYVQSVDIAAFNKI
ncbi:elongation factor 1-delta-like isoform X2 [Babylonia areolata]|uniref:elongation factor 1-delta-like isoform X2 n=1 Tax=Babylonia areolata TaxID=304850 RepID=UPI003FD2E017